MPAVPAAAEVRSRVALLLPAVRLQQRRARPAGEAHITALVQRALGVLLPPHVPSCLALLLLATDLVTQERASSTLDEVTMRPIPLAVGKWVQVGTGTVQKATPHTLMQPSAEHMS